MARLTEMPSQMPEADDDAWWARIIQDRQDAVVEINRLVRSRNKWGQRYNRLLDQQRTRQSQGYQRAIQAITIAQKTTAKQYTINLIVSVIAAIFEMGEQKIRADVNKADQST
jgi:hypothetical protein